MPPQRRYYVRLFASESLLGLNFVSRSCNRIGLEFDLGRDFRFQFRFRFGHGCRWRVADADTLFVVFLINRLDLNLLSLGYHLVVQGPAGTAGEFSHNDVAVSQELNVEVDVIDGLSC
jgi:hypothetical protein